MQSLDTDTIACNIKTTDINITNSNFHSLLLINKLSVKITVNYTKSKTYLIKCTHQIVRKETSCALTFPMTYGCPLGHSATDTIRIMTET